MTDAKIVALWLALALGAIGVEAVSLFATSPMIVMQHHTTGVVH